MGSDCRYAEDLLRGLQAAAVNNKVPPRKAAYLFLPFSPNRKGQLPQPAFPAPMLTDPKAGRAYIMPSSLYDECM